MTDLWTMLQTDHDEIWDLLTAITGGPAAPTDDVKEQRKLAKGLVRLQSAHEFAEELVIVPLVRAHCEAGDELADETLQQECQLKRALNELYHLSAGTTEFEECVNTVASENRNHLTYEQNQIWPRLQDAMDADQLEAATRRWSSARRHAPTRPHPHLPAQTAVLSTVGAVLGARDRIVDTVTGRRPPTLLNRRTKDPA